MEEYITWKARKRGGLEEKLKKGLFNLGMLMEEEIKGNGRRFCGVGEERQTVIGTGVSLGG